MAETTDDGNNRSPIWATANMILVFEKRLMKMQAETKKNGTSKKQG